MISTLRYTNEEIGDEENSRVRPSFLKELGKTSLPNYKIHRTPNCWRL